MKSFLRLLILIIIPAVSFAQNELGTFTILLGGTVGKLDPDAGGNFDAIYQNRDLSYTAVAGLGNGETFVLAKYRLFHATGNSRVSNIDATGTADWKQRILSLGFRLHNRGSAFYVDAMYVFNHAEETIGTQNPTVDVLSSTQKVDDNGFALGLGLAPRIAGPLALDFEVEYSFMLRKPSNDAGRRVPNLGGLYYGGGLLLYFAN